MLLAVIGTTVSICLARGGEYPGSDAAQAEAGDGATGAPQHTAEGETVPGLRAGAAGRARHEAQAPGLQSRRLYLQER